MNEAEQVVAGFFRAMQARDWDLAGACLADDVTVWWPVTDERFTASRFLAMQRAYPEGWEITVEEVLGGGDRVSARVAVDQGGERFWCHGWYRVVDGRIREATELWGTEGSEAPPGWRRAFTDEAAN